jgi:Flp pilus assembly protein TadD
MELENHEEAVKTFRRAVKLKPEYAEARYQLGVAYLGLRDELLESAKKEQSSLIKLNEKLAKDLQKKIKEKK